MDTSPCTSRSVFVAYIEALVGAAPHFKTTDPRLKLDARFAKAMSEFIKQEDLRFLRGRPVRGAQAPGLVRPVSARGSSPAPTTPRMGRAPLEGLGRRARKRAHSLEW